MPRFSTQFDAGASLTWEATSGAVRLIARHRDFQSFGIIGLVTLTFASWNQIAAGLRQLDRLGRFVGDASSEWL